jgi:hypothetical protein
MNTEPPTPFERCPICGGLLYHLDFSRYCPNEDPHPGGAVFFDDGLTLVSGLAIRSKMLSSPKRGGSKA